jgi:hypothetical protein
MRPAGQRYGEISEGRVDREELSAPRGQGRCPTAPRMEVAENRVRVAALLLIAGLAAGPVGTHLYWMLGGTWGLHSLAGASDEVATKGVRVVAGVVVLLLVAGVLVVLARVGLWQQTFVPDRAIRFFAWALAAVFLVETVAAFTWGRGPSGGCMGRSRSCSECWHWLSPARGKRGFVFVGHTGCSRPTDGEHIARPDRRLGDPGVNATQ